MNVHGIGMTSQRTRDRLIQRLREEGISNERVLEAMRNVPRHLFVDEALATRAYEDTALPIGQGQTISQPYIVALMTQTLLAGGRLKKVLEVGTGSGYQTAVLAQLVDEIYSVERIEPLMKLARKRLRELGCRNVNIKLSDGSWGWKEHAPYDGIIVTAAPAEVPPACRAARARWTANHPGRRAGHAGIVAGSKHGQRAFPGTPRTRQFRSARERFHLRTAHAPFNIHRMAPFRWGMAFMLVLLSSCAFPLAPVSEQGTALRHPEAGYREVQAGDTLYSIAWESGRDYRDLARWNRIASPYLIKPGQKLRLLPPAGADQAIRPELKPLPPTSNQRATAEKAPEKKKAAVEKPQTPAKQDVPAGAAKQLDWIWPAEGALLERYSANGPNKGIDIAGRKGQPILAAAAGQVVYQGGGLRGYGQLIIVKHNADFLERICPLATGFTSRRNDKRAENRRHWQHWLIGQAAFRSSIPRCSGDPQDYLPRK
jgi:protein-L-isoaspartate(D-aspartate) O-methyltransferase